MNIRKLPALTLLLSAAVLWVGSGGAATADDGTRAEVRIAQFEAEANDDAGDAGDDGDAAEDDGEAPAEGEGDAQAEEDGDAQPAEGEGEGGEQAEEAVDPGPDPVPPVFDFEGEALAENWTAFGRDAECAISRGFGEARAGQGALRLTYMPAEGSVPGVTVGPLEPVPTCSALEMSIKTTELSSIRFAVTEVDGSEYENYLASPPGEWTDVALALDEMMLAEGSEDENGALDPGQIVSISVMDLCNLPGEVGRALGVKDGLQQMWLDSVMLSENDLSARSALGPDGTVVVDEFEDAGVLALPIGGAATQTVAAPGGHALQITYRLGGHRWVGLVRGVGHLDLTGADTFGLHLKSEHRARLVVVLEERDGSKYETNIELDPAAGWTEVALPIEQFILDPTTDDENRQLDLDQLRVIILVVDTFNASVDQAGQGSVLIDRVTFQ